ncbi:energy-coupling factor transporter transmembrane component T family protein [Paraeggerthella sp. LCP19S3_G8]|uniref:energy-coupling factor transporter transmembrane component T family protein n=1 Tax=Paraeggerthella sp. LCP19S3_G8 TaxID=3440248 RepID=UPI002A8FE812|nr:energy-coupling factor transporter transmembrane component T [Paraeggerthella sp.]
METPLENCTEPFSPPSAVRQRIEPVAAGNGSAHKAAFLHADMKEGVLGLDPRTHLLVILAAGMAALAIVGLPELVGLQILCAAYLAANGRARLAARMCVSFAVICGLSFVPLPGLYGVLFVSLMHMMPPMSAGSALFTLSPSAIMCALRRWRMPNRALIGVCMVFRFASILPFEFSSIVRGLRMRGVFPRVVDAFSHLGLVYECLYTPLVMRCLRLSSELAASSELRGIDVQTGRSSIYHVGFAARDVVVVAIFACACALLYGTGFYV